MRGRELAREDSPVLEQPYGEIVQRHDRGAGGAPLPLGRQASQEVLPELVGRHEEHILPAG